jgi:hypothetical protein
LGDKKHKYPPMAKRLRFSGIYQNLSQLRGPVPKSILSCGFPNKNTMIPISNGIVQIARGALHLLRSWSPLRPLERTADLQDLRSGLRSAVLRYRSGPCAPRSGALRGAPLRKHERAPKVTHSGVTHQPWAGTILSRRGPFAAPGTGHVAIQSPSGESARLTRSSAA